MTIRIGVTGSKGNVGKALLKRGALPLFLDITNPDNINKSLRTVRPDIIVNAASKTSVDWCEQKENYPVALKINAKGTWILGAMAKELGIPVVALSTDHLFDGKRGPYDEKYRKSKPLNNYGLTKFGAEVGAAAFDNVKIVRTSNLFWKEDRRATWYLDEAYKKDKVYVPTFQKRSFMHVDHFADALLIYIENFDRMPKVLNISGSETVSWYEFLIKFAKAAEFPFVNKFKKKWFDFDANKFPAKRPQKAGLKTGLSASLGIPQYSYLDGMELINGNK